MAGLNIVLGMLYIVGGVGLLHRTLWGWWLVLVVSSVSLASAISSVAFYRNSVLGVSPQLALALVLLGSLFAMRGQFGRRA